MKHGFSLVELSIVLVILGLLTGGILAGQNLIRAAELRSVTTEFDRYVAATQTFRDKYFSLPGDFKDATKFWGKDNTNCSSDTGTAATPGACNGDGDGLAENDGFEYYQYWKQLALAGLIEGSYTGIQGSGGISHHVIGENTPRARLGNAGWAINNFAIGFVGNAWRFPTEGQVYEFGAQHTAGHSNNPVLSPEELWNVDTKMDDGRPAYGKVQAHHWDNCTDATAFTDIDSEYLLTNTAKDCAIVFIEPF